VTEEGKSMKNAIALAIQVSVKKWELYGWFMLLYGILLNVPWIWGLSFLSKGLGA